MIASPLSRTCRSSPSSDSEAKSPDLCLAISYYFSNFTLFQISSFQINFIGIAHDGSATASNFTGTPGANRVCHRREVIERLGISPPPRDEISTSWMKAAN
jgi:hypothetical protein